MLLDLPTCATTSDTRSNLYTQESIPVKREVHKLTINTAYEYTCGMQVHKWCSVFASAAAIGVCGSLLQQTGFATVGVELTRRLRLLLLSTIMRQV